jgi:hypothetical protein
MTDDLRGFSAIAYDAVSMFYRRGEWRLEPFTSRTGNTRWLLQHDGQNFGSMWCESFTHAADTADSWDVLMQTEVNHA